jgi:1,4-dihydroxy-2-naphthoate octaprenyltransferase
LTAGSGAVDRGVRPTVRERLIAYAWTSSVLGFQNLLCLPVLWTLLDDSVRGQARVRVAFALLSVSAAGAIAVGRALDDLAGYREGIDAANYLSRDGELLRSVTQKPLVSGQLTERQVKRFALVVGIVTIVAVVATVAVLPDKPVEFLPLLLLAAGFGTQYSAGLRISYRPFGLELQVLVGFATPIVLGQAVLSDGQVTGQAVVQGFLFGLWQVLVAVFSNLLDRTGDAAAGRHTMAVRFSDRANRRLILAFFVVGWMTIVAAWSAGWLTSRNVAFLVPALVMQAWQVTEGCGKGRYLVARHIGFGVVIVGMVGLALGNL